MGHAPDLSLMSSMDISPNGELLAVALKINLNSPVEISTWPNCHWFTFNPVR